MAIEIKLYEVGGCVRDSLLGVPSKDIDFVAVVTGATDVEDSWEWLRGFLQAEGFKIFVETPEFYTIRAKFPKDGPWSRFAGTDADIVLARKEGPYSDGRHPDWVEMGTLEDDLRRRDFTVNAMARDIENGDLIDLFGGLTDLEDKRLRAVGVAEDRLTEDPLRAFRALRFAVVKDFWIDPDLDWALRRVAVVEQMKSVSTERIREEVMKMFKHNTKASMQALVQDYPMYLDIIVERGLWFEPTTKGIKK